MKHDNRLTDQDISQQKGIVLCLLYAFYLFETYQKQISGAYKFRVYYFDNRGMNNNLFKT